VAITAFVCLALQAARPAPHVPAGMALIEVGTIDVGQHAWDLERECHAIGPGCDRTFLYRETPRVQVAIAPFFLDRKEVTTTQFVELLNLYRGTLTVFDDDEFHYPRFVRQSSGTGDHVLLDLDPTHGGVDYVDRKMFRVRPGFGQLPATQMTYDGATLYCALVGKRLPTDDEWEAAARGREDRRFPWGDALPRCGQVAIPEDGWIPGAEACARPRVVQPVGTMIQDVTPEGVYDLAGNVSEWTASPFVEGSRGARRIGELRDAPRVIRGGSWYASLMARTSGRDRYPRTVMGSNLGFRCASNIADAPP
jgi:formylglycine-generating enzyme required for sulfatase activity